MRSNLPAFHGDPGLDDQSVAGVEQPPGTFRLVVFLRNPHRGLEAEWSREVEVAPAPG